VGGDVVGKGGVGELSQQPDKRNRIQQQSTTVRLLRLDSPTLVGFILLPSQMPLIPFVGQQLPVRPCEAQVE